MKARWWYVLPGAIAVGGVALAIALPRERCVRSFDVVACTLYDDLKILIAAASIVLALLVTAGIAFVQRRRVRPS